MDHPGDTPLPTDALAAQQQSPAPQSLSHRIFIGPFGLRAGWSISLFFLIFGLCVGLTVLTTQAVKRSSQTIDASPRADPAQPKAPEELPPSISLLNEVFPFAGLLLATFVMAKIEGRRLRVFGIGPSRSSDIVIGALWGIGSLSALVGVLRAMHLLVFDSVALHGEAILRFGLEWLVVFIFVGLLEEYLSRGYLQYTLTRGLFDVAGRLSPKHQRAIAFWAAALVMSLFFSIGHFGNSGESRVGLLMVFIVGFVFSYALWRTGSLWWGIGYHLAWDWAQSFLWGVPDSGNVSADRLFHTHAAGNVLLSGGSVGPEGSIFAAPALLLVVLGIRLTRPGSQPPLQPEPIEHAEPLRLHITNA